MKKHAPIVIFAFNRPQHLNLLFKSLLQNPEAKTSDVTVFIDHPKGFKRTEQNLEVEKVAEQYRDSFKQFRIIIRPYNYGLAHNVINGVTEVLKNNDSVIVLEDDLELSPDFLRYMNDGLEKYAKSEKVASIHGYVYPGFNGGKEAFFVRGADCWGWGTWKRAWSTFEMDGHKLLTHIVSNGLEMDFDLGGFSPYTEMLLDQVLGKVNSWAIRWYASAFIQNQITLYPPVPLLRNTGLDNSGSHCSADERFSEQKFDLYHFKLPEKTKANKRLTVELGRKSQGSSNIGVKTFIKNILRFSLKTGYRIKLPQVEGPWQGDYPDWESARRAGSGYDDQEISEKCLFAAREVVEGRAVAERDSFILKEKDIRWPVWAGLAAGLTPEKNLVVDFGGAFGSAFRMFQDLFPPYPLLWRVVEQDLYVGKAQKHVWEKGLEFTSNLQSALKDKRLGSVLLSSSLQYIERPDLIVATILEAEPAVIVLDRVAIWPGSNRITLQTVPEHIYKASYPAWFFNEDWLVKLFQDKYLLVSNFASLDSYNIPGSASKGFVFRLKKE